MAYQELKVYKVFIFMKIIITEEQYLNLIEGKYDDILRDFNNDVLVVYHGSKGNVPIDRFSLEKSNENRPVRQKELGIHFGTEKNVRALENTGGVKPKSYIIKSDRVLRLDFVDHYFPLQINTLSSFIDSLPDEIRDRIKSDKEGYRNIVRNMDVDTIRNIIIDSGYDVIEYDNYLEDDGDSNFIVLDPSKVESYKI
jgi:hypothetical protein